MYPYYKKDVEAGRLTDDEAVELLAHIWIKCTAIIKLMDSVTTRTFAGFPLFQNITLGGQGPRGEDACNELTGLIMEAAAVARVPQPSLSFRYHNKVDPDALLKACETIKLWAWLSRGHERQLYHPQTPDTRRDARGGAGLLHELRGI